MSLMHNITMPLVLAQPDFPDSTLGEEMVIDPYLKDLSNWQVTGGGSLIELSTGAPAGFTRFLRGQSGDGMYDYMYPDSDILGFEIGKTYRTKALVKAGSNSGNVQGLFTFSFTDGNVSEVVTGTSWEWLEQDFVATATQGIPRVYFNRGTGNTSDKLDTAYVSIKEVL